AHGIGIALVSLGLSVRPDDVRQPMPEVGREGLRLRSEVEAGLDLTLQRPELLARFSLRGAGSALVLDGSAGVEADGDLGDPFRVVAPLIDRALAVCSLALPLRPLR